MSSFNFRRRGRATRLPVLTALVCILLAATPGPPTHAGPVSELESAYRLAKEIIADLFPPPVPPEAPQALYLYAASVSTRNLRSTRGETFQCGEADCRWVMLVYRVSNTCTIPVFFEPADLQFVSGDSAGLTVNLAAHIAQFGDPSMPLYVWEGNRLAVRQSGADLRAALVEVPAIAEITSAGWISAGESREGYNLYAVRDFTEAQERRLRYQPFFGSNRYGDNPAYDRIKGCRFSFQLQ